jgi:hypothetical protein
MKTEHDYYLCDTDVVYFPLCRKVTCIHGTTHVASQEYYEFYNSDRSEWIMWRDKDRPGEQHFTSISSSEALARVM